MYPPSSSTVTIEPVWLRTMHQLCATFDVKPIVGEAFLGSGAHGKVFRVSRTSGTYNTRSATTSSSAATIPFALKIVDHRHQDSLDAEHGKLQRLTSKAADQRVSILPTFVSSKVEYVIDPSDGPLGSGILLQPVGRWVWAERPSNIQTVLFEVLDALVKLHQLDVVHGDARLENLLRVDDQLVWIDFRECHIDASQEIQRWWDLRTCLDSFLRHYHNDHTKPAEWEGLQVPYKQVFKSSSLLLSPEWRRFKQLVWKRLTTTVTVA